MMISARLKARSPSIGSRVNDMSAPRLSVEIKQAIVRDYLAKIPIRALAEKYGVHQSYPGLLSRRRGVEPNRNFGPKPDRHTGE
jgi:transposase-like protein